MTPPGPVGGGGSPKRRKRPSKDRQTIAEQCRLLAEMASHNCLLRTALVDLLNQTTGKEALCTINCALETLDHESPDAIILEAAHILVTELERAEVGTPDHALHVALRKILDFRAKRRGRT